MYSSSFYPLITKPKRITRTTATLIDNIFLNKFDNKIRTVLLITTLRAVLCQGRTLRATGWFSIEHAHPGDAYVKTSNSVTSSSTSCFAGNIRDLNIQRQDDNKDVNKKIGLISKTTTLPMHHAFLCISLSFLWFLHDYDVKMPNFAFYG